MDTNNTEPRDELPPYSGENSERYPSSTMQTLFPLFVLLFVFFSIFILTIKLTCQWRNDRQRRNLAFVSGMRYVGASQNNETANAPSGKKKKVKRSPEEIKKMLILKKAVLCTSSSESENTVSTASTTDEQGARGGSESSSIGDIESNEPTTADFHTRIANEPETTTKMEYVVLPCPGNDGICPICLGEYEEGDTICFSQNQSCPHHFHSECGVAWLIKHSDCPLCRSPYLVESTGAATPSNSSAGQVNPAFPYATEQVQGTGELQENINGEPDIEAPP